MLFRSQDRQFKILLVDDSEDNRLLITHYLKSSPIDCDEASNGKEAVEKFRNGKYDLVFMDMQMPIMSGYKATEVIRHMEAAENRNHTPIVALTATAVLEELQRSLKSGCDRYMVKPVKKAEILQMLVEMLIPKNQLTSPKPGDSFPKEPPQMTI